MPKKKRPRDPEPADLRRLARLARSFVPRGARERDLGDLDAVRELVFLVGGAAGRAFGVWSEIAVRTFALALADLEDEEALSRTVRIWRAVASLGKADRGRLRRAVADLLRERAEEDPPPAGPRRVGGTGR